MIKVVKNRNWILDIPKTEAWLNQMCAQGYVLESANLKKGEFIFQNSNPNTAYYKIAYKQSGITPEEYSNEGYDMVLRSGDYYILKTKIEAPKLVPSFNKLLDKNIKRKFNLSGYNSPTLASDNIA